MSNVTEYRGWKIEKIETTQVGYRTSGHELIRGSGIKPSGGTPGHGRKMNGYLVHYPADQGNGTKFVSTLKAAKDYINDYMGWSA